MKRLGLFWKIVPLFNAEKKAVKSSNHLKCMSSSQHRIAGVKWLETISRMHLGNLLSWTTAQLNLCTQAYVSGMQLPGYDRRVPSPSTHGPGQWAPLLDCRVDVITLRTAPSPIHVCVVSRRLSRHLLDRPTATAERQRKLGMVTGRRTRGVSRFAISKSNRGSLNRITNRIPRL